MPLFDQKLISFGGHAAIGGFIQWGWVPQNRNEVTGYFGTGLHMHGLIPGRDEDDMGIAVARADTRTAAESTIELTYRMTVAPWLALQSLFQWIINPGGDNTASVIKVGLLRFEVTL
ncbi:MAG: carbohydrate porin [Mariprofundaceae bacterium]|nr:carbohydrate porin [Mariprofundaceae bacterium]